MLQKQHIIYRDLMQPEQAADRLQLLVRNICSLSHLLCKFIEHGRQLPKLHHDRITAF